MLSKLIEGIKSYYPDKMIMGASMIPNQNFSCSPIEPYNAVLAINRVIENDDISLVLVNNSLS